jgi:hypothetical protein
LVTQLSPKPLNLELCVRTCCPSPVRSFSKTIVKYPKTSAIVFLLTLSSLLFAFYWLEPFSPKYQRKTVDDWLAYWAKNDRFVPDDVIMAFGTNAVPALEHAIDTLTSIRCRLKDHTGIFIILDQTFLLYGKDRKARQWGKSLYLNSSTSRLELLSTTRSPQLVLAMLNGSPQVDLEHYAAQTTNSMLKTNAELALTLGEMFHRYHRRDQYLLSPNIIFDDPIKNASTSKAPVEQDYRIQK